MKKNELIGYSAFEQASLSEEIFQSLKSIELHLRKEIVSKQNTIERQEHELKHLRSDVNRKNAVLNDLNKKILECQKSTEGSRQLINKLLNDIDRLQQDVDWYKRTYENRSVLGTLKQKFFKRRL